MHSSSSKKRYSSGLKKLLKMKSFFGEKKKALIFALPIEKRVTKIVLKTGETVGSKGS